MPLGKVGQMEGRPISDQAYSTWICLTQCVSETVAFKKKKTYFGKSLKITNHGYDAGKSMLSMSIFLANSGYLAQQFPGAQLGPKNLSFLVLNTFLQIF